MNVRVSRLSTLLTSLALSSLCASVHAATEVTIYRDDWGVPHIYSATEEAGFYGLGYAQAEDRLERILRLYMWALGRMAELDGEAGTENDARVLMWRHVEEARAGYERLNPQIQANYAWFIAGIQRFIDDHPHAVPGWAPRLAPFLPFLVQRYSRWGAAIAAGTRDCRASGLPLAEHAVPAEPDSLDSAYASNEWALSPWRTKHGAAILLGDPHGIGFGWRYEFFLKAGPFETMGHTTIGAALPVLGHTRYVAWTWTTGAPDLADCYRVELSADGMHYEYDGEEIEIERRDATIKVKDAESVSRQFAYTRHNDVLSPIVARDGDTAYALSSPYMHEWLWDEEMYRQNLARDVDEFRDALSILGHHGENVMAADSSGNVLYVRTGKTPKRPDGYDWSQPVPGNTSATAWTGIHSIDDLVQIKNPPQGYMQNNNVPPFMIMKDSPLTPDRYPSYIYNSSPIPNESGVGARWPRGDLANDILSRAFHVTAEDAVAIALDHRWPYVSPWLEALQQALDQRPERAQSETREFRLLADRLLRFDGIAAADSSSALTFYYWRMAMGEMLGDEAVRNLIERIEYGEPTSDDVDVFLDAITRTLERMDDVHGSLDAVLSDVFRIKRDTESWPVNGPAFKVGDVLYPPLRVFYFDPAEESSGVRWAFGGSKAMRLTILSDPVQSYSLVVWGSNDNEDSPHYDDQVRLLVSPGIKRNFFGMDQLEGHISKITVLTIDTQ